MVWNCAKEAGNSAGFGTAEVSPGPDEVYDTENVPGPCRALCLSDYWGQKCSVGMYS